MSNNIAKREWLEERWSHSGMIRELHGMEKQKGDSAERGKQLMQPSWCQVPTGAEETEEAFLIQKLSQETWVESLPMFPFMSGI